MLGELYLLQNIDVFKNFPDHKSFDSVSKSLFDNYKNKLQVIIQKEFKLTPDYVELQD